MRNKKYNVHDQRNLKLFLILNRCSQSVNKNISKIFKKFNITEAQFNVLELLYHKGDMRIKSIIEKTFSSGGTMTVIIDNLEKEKLIERKTDPVDRRAYLISLTDLGRERIEGVFDKHIENLDKALSILEDEEKVQVINLLKKLGKFQ